MRSSVQRAGVLSAAAALCCACGTIATAAAVDATKTISVTDQPPACLQLGSATISLGISSDSAFRFAVSFETNVPQLGEPDCEPLPELSSPMLSPARNQSVPSRTSIESISGGDGVRLRLSTSFGALEVDTEPGAWRHLDARNTTLIGGALPMLLMNNGSPDNASVHLIPDRDVATQPQSCLENGGQNWVAEPGFTPAFLFDPDHRFLAMPISQFKYDSRRFNCYPAGFNGDDRQGLHPPAPKCIALMRRLCPYGPNFWRCHNCMQNHADDLRQAECSAQAQHTFCSQSPRSIWPDQGRCSSSGLLDGMDAKGATRSDSAPSGLLVGAESQCCTACESLDRRSCSAFVYSEVPTPSGKNCWLLSNFSGFINRPGRIIGVRRHSGDVSSEIRPQTPSRPSWWSHGRRVDWILAPVSGRSAMFQVLRGLSGATDVPPLYAFGFLATYWGWTQQAEVESNISEFRTGKYPIDAIIMDYDWFGTEITNYRDFGYNPDTMTNSRFNNLSSLLSHYYDAYGIRFGGIRKPRTYDHIELVQNTPGWNLAWPDPLGRVHEMNFSSPTLREWYANNTAPLIDSGVEFFWNDEADFSNQYFAYHFQTLAQQQASQRTRLAARDRRSWSINRAFTLGMQRHGAVTWSGDGQDCSHSMIVQMSLYGQALSCCDMTSPDATVLLRQYQNAVWSPIMRVHGGLPLVEPGGRHPPPRFPFVFCGQASKALGGTEAHCAGFRKALNLRYQLVPYMYSLAYQTRATGIPIATPASMWFPEYQDLDESTMAIGGAILPARVSTAHTIDPAVNVTNVSLPRGTWFRFNSTSVQFGPKHFSTTLENLNDMWAFVKTGTIIVLNRDAVQSTDELGGVLEVHIYGGADAKFTMTEDDGYTTAYERSAVFTYWKWSETDTTLTWDMSGAVHMTKYKFVDVILFLSGKQRQVSRGHKFSGSGRVNFTIAATVPLPMPKPDSSELGVGSQLLDLFVSTRAGNDVNPGTKDHPVRSLARASQWLLTNGIDTSTCRVLLERGSLWVGETLELHNSSIIVSTYGSGELAPTIAHAPSFLANWSVGVAAYSVSNVSIAGIQFVGSTAGIIFFYDEPSNTNQQHLQGQLTVEHCVFRDIRGPDQAYPVNSGNPGGGVAIAVVTNTLRAPGARNATVSNVVVRNNVALRVDSLWNQIWHDRMHSFLTNVNLDGNTASQCGFNCVGFLTGTHLILQNSVFMDHSSYRFSPYGVTDLIIGSLDETSAVVNNEFTGRGVFPGEADGCAIDFETFANGTLVANNTFAHNWGAGVNVYGAHGAGCVNLRFEHNVFIKNGCLTTRADRGGIEYNHCPQALLPTGVIVANIFKSCTNATAIITCDGWTGEIHSNSINDPDVCVSQPPLISTGPTRPGTHALQIHVQLTPMTSRDARIRYTIDGSRPTESSPELNVNASTGVSEGIFPTWPAKPRAFIFRTFEKGCIASPASGVVMELDRSWAPHRAEGAEVRGWLS